MPEKRSIIEVLEERELLLPQLLHEALAANTRIKYLLSLLQVARVHADQPEAELPQLRGERLACGLDEPSLDRIPSASELRPSGIYHIPGAGELVARLYDDVGRMICPLWDADQKSTREAREFTHRLRTLRLAQGPLHGDTVSGQAISQMSSGDRTHGDSLHLLVMDAHRALNTLAAHVATETIEGAQVYTIDDTDRPLVTAFMQGVNQTARLKFQHRGLATTATRAGRQLIIENDIGETDAHVLVVHVEGLKVKVTTTDVHLPRIQFFRGLFRGVPLVWEETKVRRAPELGTELFYLCAGTLLVHERGELEQFLFLLGSRLVFLIDWNRARKQLREFVSKSQSVLLLERAAEEGHGHRGFLELGGAALVYDAMTAVLRTPFRFGERLDDILDHEQASAFLTFVLRQSATGLLAGRSHSLLRELVRAKLAREVARRGERLLGPAQRHADLVDWLARAVAESLDGEKAGTRTGRESAARSAKEHERAADDIVVQMRSLAERIPKASQYCQIVEAADDAADALEEAAFQLTLLPILTAVPPVSAGLSQLSRLVAVASAMYVRCLRSAQTARAHGLAAEVQEVLESVDRVLEVEREADDVQRRVASALCQPAVDARVHLLATQLAGHLESAADALMHASLLVRDTVLGAVMIDQD